VVRHWGRHGTNGQSSVHSAYSEWAAEVAAEELYYKKHDKGYRPEVNVLDRFARELD
jgi:predicted DNA-binding WGR domain protein